MNQAATGRRHQVSERDQAETELRTTQALPLASQRRLAALAVAPCAARTDQGRPLECAHQRSSAAAHSLLTLFVSAIARRRLRLRVCVLGIVCDVGRTNEARQVRRRRSMRADTRSVGSRGRGWEKEPFFWRSCHRRRARSSRCTAPSSRAGGASVYHRIEHNARSRGISRHARRGRERVHRAFSVLP